MRYSKTASVVAREAGATYPTVRKYKPSLPHIVTDSGITLYSDDSPERVRRLKEQAIARRNGGGRR